MNAQEAADRVAEKFSDALMSRKEFRGEHTVRLQKIEMSYIGG